MTGNGYRFVGGLVMWLAAGACLAVSAAVVGFESLEPGFAITAAQNDEGFEQDPRHWSSLAADGRVGRIVSKSGAEGRCLLLDADGRVDRHWRRTVEGAQNVGAGAAFEADVRFSLADGGLEETDPTDKIALWLEESEETDGVGRLRVRAGDGQGGTCDWQIAGECDPACWHHLKICLLTDITEGAGVAGLVIMLDGVRLRWTNEDGERFFFGFRLNAAAGKLVEAHELFLSRRQAPNVDAASFGVAGFLGLGEVDDLGFETDFSDAFGEESLVALNWSEEGLQDLAWSVDGGDWVKADLAAGRAVVECGLRTQDHVVRIRQLVDSAAGYCAEVPLCRGGCECACQAEEWVVTVQSEAPWAAVTMAVMKPLAWLGDGRGYKNLAEAVEAAGDGETVTLAGDCELVESVELSSERSLTLDLNGWSVRGVGANAPLTNRGQLTIVDGGQGRRGRIEASAEADGNYREIAIANIGKNAKVVIVGGDFSGLIAAPAGLKSGLVVVGGGAFETQAEVFPLQSSLAEGMVPVRMRDGNGFVVVSETMPVASVFMEAGELGVMVDGTDERLDYRLLGASMLEGPYEAVSEPKSGMEGPLTLKVGLRGERQGFYRLQIGGKMRTKVVR